MNFADAIQLTAKLVIRNVAALRNESVILSRSNTGLCETF